MRCDVGGRHVPPLPLLSLCRLLYDMLVCCDDLHAVIALLCFGVWKEYVDEKKKLTVSNKTAMQCPYIFINMPMDGQFFVGRAGIFFFRKA